MQILDKVYDMKAKELAIDTELKTTVVPEVEIPEPKVTDVKVEVPNAPNTTVAWETKLLKMAGAEHLPRSKLRVPMTLISGILLIILLTLIIYEAIKLSIRYMKAKRSGANAWDVEKGFGYDDAFDAADCPLTPTEVFADKV